MHSQNEANPGDVARLTVSSDDIRACLADIDVIRGDESLADDESLFERGLIDSLGIAILITHLEKKFQISVPQQDLLPDNFDTISAIADYVNSRIRAKRQK